MKKIKQNIEVNANILEFKEKLALLPLVEILAASIRTDKAVKLNVEDTLTISIQPKVSETIYKILKEIIDEDLEDITGYVNPKSILLVNPGANKIAVVKLIRDCLHLCLKEAKDLVDNAPVEINLKDYNISKSEANDLYNLLVKEGANVKKYSKSVWQHLISRE